MVFINVLKGHLFSTVFKRTDLAHIKPEKEGKL